MVLVDDASPPSFPPLTHVATLLPISVQTVFLAGASMVMGGWSCLCSCFSCFSMVGCMQMKNRGGGWGGDRGGEADDAKGYGVGALPSLRVPPLVGAGIVLLCTCN